MIYILAKHQSAKLSRMKNMLEKLARKLVGFVIYGPGVLGLLWLIGRFLKR